jgi:hypothetical protein
VVPTPLEVADDTITATAGGEAAPSPEALLILSDRRA